MRSKLVSTIIRGSLAGVFLVSCAGCVADGDGQYDRSAAAAPRLAALAKTWSAFAVGMISGDDFDAPEPWTRKLWLALEAEGLSPVCITFPGSDELIGSNQPPLVPPYVSIKSAKPGAPGCIRSVVLAVGVSPSLRNLEVDTRPEGIAVAGDADRCIRLHAANLKKEMIERGY